MNNKTIEFFVDTYGQESFAYVNEIVEESGVSVVSIMSEEDAGFFHLQGKWTDYRKFIQREKVNYLLPENAKFKYSLYHYEE